MSRQRTFWRDKFKIGGQTMAETDKKLKEITERLEQGVKEIFYIRALYRISGYDVKIS